MSERGDAECIGDIMESIRRIQAYTKGMTYQKFLKDSKTQDAVVRNIEIIGEAVKNISSDFKKKRRTIEWEKIAGMRDKLVHRYFGVNLDIVWDVVREKLPELRNQIKALGIIVKYYI